MVNAVILPNVCECHHNLNTKVFRQSVKTPNPRRNTIRLQNMSTTNSNESTGGHFTNPAPSLGSEPFHLCMHALMQSIDQSVIATHEAAYTTIAKIIRSWAQSSSLQMDGILVRCEDHSYMYM